MFIYAYYVHPNRQSGTTYVILSHAAPYNELYEMNNSSVAADIVTAIIGTAAEPH